MKSNTRLVLAVALLLSLFLSAHSQLLAIDFSSQYIKASVVHSGAGKAFSIVENNKSERKFLNAVQLGFFNEERQYESDSLSKRTKVPENCFLFSRLLVDLNKQPSLLSVVKKDLILQYIDENLEDQFLAEFVLKKFPEDTKQITLLEVLTMMLKYVRLEAQKYAKSAIKDAVLVLPNYWNIHQRNFLLEAAAIADIYVLSIISENAAASVNYAVSNRNQNKTETILFYNVGANALQMTLAEYRQVVTDKSPKGVESIFIKDDYGKPYVGGLKLDAILCKHFAKVFEQKHKKSLNQRGMIKLLAESTKVKEVLSANKEANLFVEGIMDGIDFFAKITRADFQKQIEQVLQDLVSPIRRFLLDNDLKPTDLTAVELIGGGTRIPKLQSMIVDILDGQKEKVGTHINADEAMALGGAFFAANSSKKFKVKGINLYDGFNFQIRLVLKNLDETIEQSSSNYFFKNATIFKKKSRYGLTKEVNFKCSQNIKVQLYKVQPQTGEQQLLKTYELDRIQKINQTDYKVSLTFSINPIDVVTLKQSKFTYKRDEISTYSEKVRKQKPKTTDDQKESQDGGDDDSEAEQQQETQSQTKKVNNDNNDDDQETIESVKQSKTTETETQTTQQEKQENTNKQQIEQQQQQTTNDEDEDEQQEKKKSKNNKSKQKKKKKKQKIQYETVQKNKTITKKYEKDLTSKNVYNIRKLEQTMSEKSRKMLQKYQAAEQKKRQLAEAKDKLQALIYETKDKLENEEFTKFAQEQQRENIKKLSQQKQAWFDQSYSKDSNQYKKQHSQLNKPFQRVKRRITEYSERQNTKKKALEQIKQYKNLTETIQKGKDWITDQQVEALKESLNTHEEQINNFYAAMQESSIDKDSIYRNKDLTKQAIDAKQKYFALKAKPKPKKQQKQSKSESESKSEDVNSEEL